MIVRCCFHALFLSPVSYFTQLLKTFLSNSVFFINNVLTAGLHFANQLEENISLHSLRSYRSLFVLIVKSILFKL